MIDHYNAFISYRHAPLDSKVAAEIQTRLERFRIPKAIRKSSGIRKIDRIFRDKEELLITSDLNETIENALIHSDFLIVICSYATRESVWVQREIEFFLKTHSRKQILTVVAEGEPCDVVPKILMEQEVTVTLDSGEEEVVTMPVEPLSCDYRGSFQKARKEELPRLAAAILGCSYDELKQRQRQYRVRQMTMAFSAVALLLAALSAYYAWSASQIQANYILSLRNQSQYLSSESLALLEQGDRISAIQLALEALPKNDEDPRPVLPEAEYALAQAVNAYVSPNTNWYAVEYSFPHGGTINRILTNHAEDHLFVFHSSSTFTVWDVESREKLMEQIMPSYVSHSAVSFDDKLLILSGYILYCYDYRSGDVLWQLNAKDYLGGSANPDFFAVSETAPIAAMTAGDYLVTINTADGSILQQVPLPTYEHEYDFTDETVFEYGIQYAKFSPDNKKLFLHLSGAEDYLALCDLEKETIQVNTLTFARVDDAFFTEDGNIIFIGMYYWRNGNYWIRPLYYYEDAFSEVGCLGPEGNLLWGQEIHYTEMAVGLGDEVIPFTYTDDEGKSTPAVACVAGEKLAFLDTATGKVLKENAYTSAIVTLALYENHFSTVLTDGMIGQYILSANKNMAADFCIDGIDMATDNERLFACDSATGNVLLYTYALHDDNWEEMNTTGQLEDSFFNFYKHVSGNVTLLTRYDKFEETFVVINSASRTVRFYDPLPESVYTNKKFLGLSEDGRYLLFKPFSTGNSIQAYDLETCQIVPSHYRLTIENDAMDAFLPQGDKLYYMTSARDKNDKVSDVFIRQYPDGLLDYWYIETVDPESYFDDLLLLSPQADAVLLKDSFYGGNGHYYALDMQTGVCSHTDTIPLYESQVIWAPDGSGFFATDENCIRAFDRTCKEIYRIPCNGMTPGSIFATGDNLLVLYGTDKIYRYQVSDGTFLSKIDIDAGPSDSASSDCRWDDSQPGTLALFNNETLNLIDTEHWIARTQVDDCIGFCLKEGLIFTTQSGTDSQLHFGYYELYSYKDLIDIAKKQLGSLELSQEMRSKYGLS